jgi:hypothetical protein
MELSYRFFSERQAAVFRALLETIVPGADPALVNEADRIMASKPPDLRRKTKLFLMIVNLLPLLRWLRPFTSLTASERERFLGFLATGPIRLFRLGFFGVRSVALIAHYGADASFPRLGYRGPIVAERARRLEEPSDPYALPKSSGYSQ